MSQVTSHKSQVTSHKSKRLRRGFTLIEMMVVIGIIAILSTFVVPGIKKAYTDFKLSIIFDRVDTIMSGMRSAYLIFSAPPAAVDSTYFYCDPKFAHFLPHDWVDPSKTFVQSGRECWRLEIPDLYTRPLSCYYSLPRFEMRLCNSTSRPYYFDYLVNMSRRKGYLTTDSPTEIHIYLPEKHNGWYF